MAKTKKQIWFKHTKGTKKFIPGVTNHLDLAPRLIQEVDRSVPGRERPIMRSNMDYVVKINLLDEDIEIRLTEKEKKYPQAVQDKIMARRAEEADSLIRINNAIRDTVRSYEHSGDLQVIDWEKEVSESDVSSTDLITELSPIAIADFEARGINIPERLRRAPVSSLGSAGDTVEVHEVIKKPRRKED